MHINGFAQIPLTDSMTSTLKRKVAQMLLARVRGKNAKTLKAPLDVIYVTCPVSNVICNSLSCVPKSLGKGTIMFVHGPQGSGKTRLITSLLKDTKRCVDARLVRIGIGF